MRRMRYGAPGMRCPCSCGAMPHTWQGRSARSEACQCRGQGRQRLKACAELGRQCAETGTTAVEPAAACHCMQLTGQGSTAF